MTKVAESLVEVESVFYESGMYLRPEELKRLEFHILRFGRHYQYLRSLSEADGVQSFPVTIKVHMMQHLPRENILINSRFTQCYVEEGNIGRVSKIWRSVINGPWRKHAQRNVLLKWLVGFELRMLGAA